MLGFFPAMVLAQFVAPVRLLNDTAPGSKLQSVGASSVGISSAAHNVPFVESANQGLANSNRSISIVQTGDGALSHVDAKIQSIRDAAFGASAPASSLSPNSPPNPTPIH